MPPVLGFMPGCDSTVPSNEWRVDGGRQVVGHETDKKVNSDEHVVGDKAPSLMTADTIFLWELMNLRGTAPVCSCLV